MLRAEAEVRMDLKSCNDLDVTYRRNWIFVQGSEVKFAKPERGLRSLGEIPWLGWESEIRRLDVGTIHCRENQKSWQWCKMMCLDWLWSEKLRCKHIKNTFLIFNCLFAAFGVINCSCKALWMANCGNSMQMKVWEPIGCSGRRRTCIDGQTMKKNIHIICIYITIYYEVPKLVSIFVY